MTPDTDETAEATNPRTVREERTLGPMRATIADRLAESYRNAVHVTVSREADAEALMAAADRADESLDVDASILDVILVAVSQALSDHPEFNATFEDDRHRLYEEHNLGVAVDIEQGLVAPVIGDVANRSLGEIVTERRRLTALVTAGEHSMSDLKGGTFTVTNLGVLGVDSFTPVINPPQIAILGVNRLRDRAVSGKEGVEFRPHLNLDLSFDHRIVDGADAARFLGQLVELLEESEALLEANGPL